MATEKTGRMELWEIRDQQGGHHRIVIDRYSIDDKLYLLRRLQDLATVEPNRGPGCQVHYLGIDS